MRAVEFVIDSNDDSLDDAPDGSARGGQALHLASSGNGSVDVSVDGGPVVQVPYVQLYRAASAIYELNRDLRKSER